MKEKFMSCLTMIKKEPKRLIILAIILAILMLLPPFCSFMSEIVGGVAYPLGVISELGILAVVMGLVIGLFFASDAFVIALLNH